MRVSMDVKREVKQTKILGVVNKKQLLITASLVLISIFTWKVSNSSNSLSISKDKIWTGVVQSGQLKLQVQGYGKLQSKEQWLLTAPVKATIKKILLKPGAKVTPDSIIMQLQNPELVQQVINQTLELKSLQANLRQMRLNLRREYLAQQGYLAELDANHATVSLRLESTRSLAAKGIVSQFDFKSAELQERQLKKRLQIENERLEQLSEVHKESLNIQKEVINRQQGILDAVINKQKLLTVRAGIIGVLQQLPIELGQSVNDGQKLALVGGTDKLLALANVAQSQVDRIQVGQTVEINTRGGIANGSVARIDPIVKEGSVLVEIEITGKLPENARPELNVDVLIHTGKLTNAYFIERPVNSQTGSSMTMFRELVQGDKAEAIKVSFGEQTDQYIQILSGALEGDKLILSDTSLWENEKTLIYN
jgi:HlyD family secretion protein